MAKTTNTKGNKVTKAWVPQSLPKPRPQFGPAKEAPRFLVSRDGNGNVVVSQAIRPGVYRRMDPEALVPDELALEVYDAVTAFFANELKGGAK